jgi:hypothetical protein
LDLHVHAGSASPDVTRDVGRVVGTAAGDDHNFEDLCAGGFLRQKSREDAANVRSLVVSRDDDGNVHVVWVGDGVFFSLGAALGPVS